MNKLEDTGEVEIGRWVKKESLPYGKISCADCSKWKPLLYVGKDGEQTWLCEDCLKKVIKNKRFANVGVSE